tara:strand:+ start:681 stop:1142 length:462 start_codon:yes stop_codon:yes gene_type:complete
MHNYLNFKSRLDTRPRVKTPLVSEIYFAWCYKMENPSEGIGNHCEPFHWEEGDSLISPSDPAISIQDLEEDRASKFDYDYGKGYFDDHYLMLVVKTIRGDKEKTLFFTPEHAYSLLSELTARALQGDTIQGDILQTEYSREELNLTEEEEDNE